MNLYELNRENKEEAKALSVLGIDNFVIQFEHDRDVFYSCTCGSLSKIKTYNNKSKGYCCDVCNAKKVFTFEPNDTNYITNINPVIYEEDEESVTIDLQPMGIIEDEWNKSLIRFEPNPEVYVLKIMKKENKILVYDSIPYEDPYCWTKYDMPSSEITIDSCKDYYLYSDELDINDESNGMRKLYDILSKYFTFTLPSEYISIEDMIFLAELSSYPAIYEYTEQGSYSLFGKRIISLNDIYEFEDMILNTDIDLKEKDLQKAFGLSFEELKNITSLEDYNLMIKYKKNIKEYGLEEYLMLQDIVLSFSIITNIEGLFEKSQCENFETFIKFVFRGTCNEKRDISSILSDISKIISNGYEYLLDYNKSYNSKLLRKMEFEKDGIMSTKDFGLLEKKPTLDNLYKLLS